MSNDYNSGRGGGGYRQPLYPKPFEYINLPEGRPSRARPQTHEQIGVNLVSGQLSGRIRTLGPVHVGSGILQLTKLLQLPQGSSKLLNKYPMVRSFVTSNGKRVIPGSSLKGSVRSVVEAITQSCVSKRGSRSPVPEELRECRAKDYLCPACRLFGAMGYLGKVKFSDAVQDGERVEIWELPQMYRPRTENPDGRKFYKHGKQARGDTPVEAVPAGDFFNFSVRFDNLEATELGLLVLALGLSPRVEETLTLKLGGFKPACLGSVVFEPERLTIEAAKESCLDYDALEADLVTDAEVMKRRFEGWVSQARRSSVVLLDNLAQLAETLKFSDTRECPPGMY